MPGYRDQQPRIVSWAGALEDVDLVQGVTPAARLEYLYALLDRITAACTCPYAIPGLASDMRSERVVGVVVNIATQYLRPLVVAATTDESGSPDDVSVWAEADAGGASDELLIPVDGGSGAHVWPPYVGVVSVMQGAEVVEASPAAPMDRLAAVTAQLAAASVEVFRVTNAEGFSVWPFLVDDLSAL